MNNLKVIAHIHTDFPDKFGIPRQSGLCPLAVGVIRFEDEYKDPLYIKGLDEFSHLWLLWEFEDVKRESSSPLVRPPRLGGNETRGVFATRSPFRPNPIGLSSVKLEKIEYTKEGPLIYVSGVDLRDNTPIFDIKPYLGYADSHPDAKDGFAGERKDESLEVIFPKELLSIFPTSKRDTILEVLKEDPRPHYQDDPDRIYGVYFADFNVRFKVNNKTLTVLSVERK